MSVPVEHVLLQSLGQAGDRYVFGAEASPLDPNPSRWDCSELVEWSCARAGVTPKVPDGAYYQWMHARPVTMAVGLATRGALLFVGDGTGVGRQAITHVAWSLGNGTTIEARGAKWGVGTWAAGRRFQFAGLLPGIDHRPPTPRETLMATFRNDDEERTAWVMAAYAMFMGHQRRPDLGEIQFWRDQMRQVGVPAALNAIYDSDEAKKYRAAL